MDLKFISTLIQEKANDLNCIISGLKWYIFGSLLNNKIYFNDIDILVIYENENDPVFIKSYLQDLNLSLPLHFVFMTIEEENEFQFIKMQKAIQIFPPE